MAHITHTTKATSAKDIERKWILVDLDGKVLGRVAPTISKYLQGKHKTTYSSNIDSGDYVVAINAKKIVVTGKKAQTKTYTRYSGYPGGLKRISYGTFMNERPQEIIKHAVSGMLPKNKLRDQRIKRLYIFADNVHPYENKITNSKNQIAHI